MPVGIAVSDFYYILPELVLTAGSLLLLVADVLLPRGSKALTWVAVGALVATLLYLDARIRLEGLDLQVAAANLNREARPAR